MNFSYAENQTQKQNQSLKLILTAEMRESLELLQMPLAQLREKVEDALMENPVLEYDEDYQAESNDFIDPALDISGESYKGNDADLELAKRLFSDGFTSAPYGSYCGDEENFDPYTTLSAKITFTDYLVEQLGELKINKTIEKICRYIIEDLDEIGYLRCSPDELSQDLEIPLDMIRDALEIVQRLLPLGVGAANLQECLLIQLKGNTEINADITEKIVGSYLELLAENKIRLIAQKLATSLESAQSCCNYIRRLNPIPSSGFRTEAREIYVIPEATIQKDSNGGFFIQSNDNTIPPLRINSLYQKMLQEGTDKETEDYLRNKIKRAASMIKEVSNRQKTIVRILEKIVELQRLFFESGIERLKPMSILDVADPLCLHESTVSRAISGKYISCQFGTISLKSLFTSKLHAQQGDDCFSSAQIKQSIHALVEHEDKAAPLSDQNITNTLQKRGIEISRRTVAKYRDEMHISIAGKRKVYD